MNKVSYQQFGCINAFDGALPGVRHTLVELQAQLDKYWFAVAELAVCVEVPTMFATIVTLKSTH